MAYNWSPLDIARGPVNLWASLAVPGAGARMTIENATGEPDATANPNKVHLGRTTEGATLLYRPSFDYRRSDEFAAPYSALPGETEELAIEFSMLQILNYPVWDLICPTGTKATGAGYEEMAFGGKATITTTSVAAIWRDTEDTSKWVVWHIYKSLNEAGLEFNIRRTADAFSRVRFVGQTVDGRAAGDQIGKWWRQIT